MGARKKTKRKWLKRSLVTICVFLAVFVLVDKVLMPRYVQQGRTTKVPNVVGKQLDEALRILAESGLEGKKADVRADREYPEGTVVMQNPPADAEVKFERGVYLTVSGGETMVPVPSLRGRTIRDATFALERHGLLLGKIRYEFSDEFPQNTIIDQEIPEGLRVPTGRGINVIVSQGKSSDRIPVPEVVKRTLSEAERLLVQSGLRIGNITFQVSDELLPNTVMDQYPRPGELVPAGQAVDLFVAQKGEKPGGPEY